MAIFVLKLDIFTYKSSVRVVRLPKFAIGVISCSMYAYDTVTFSTRSPEVIKGHISNSTTDPRTI